MEVCRREALMIKQQEVVWKEVRNEIWALNPELAKIIDEISPGKEFTFSKVIYPYGAEILRNAELNLPDENNELIPFRSNSVNAHIKEQLGYNFSSNPVAILLKNTIELSINLDERIIPYSIVYPGKLFGAWRILDGLNKDKSFPKNSTFFNGCIRISKQNT